MTIKVAQWATGGVGKAAIQDVLAHPELELVGAWVHSEDKHGKDVGEIIGEGPIADGRTLPVGRGSHNRLMEFLDAPTGLHKINSEPIE